MKSFSNFINNILVKALKKYVIVFVLIFIILVFGIISPVFLSVNNLVTILNQNAYLIIATVGVTMVMISGGTDLSVGYQISLVGVVTTILIKWVGLPIYISITIGLLVGSFLGFINGFASVKLKVHPMITTLGTMTIFQGISYILSQSKAIYDLPEGFKFIGQGYIGPIPFSVIMMIVIALIATFILQKTYFGRYIYAIGGNPEAARLAGINVNAMKVIVFSISGLFVAIAAIVLVGRSGAANSSMGPGTEFSAITAAVLGGVSFKGGEGEVWAVVTGVLILGVLANGMQIVGFGIYPQYIVKGLILLAAIGFDTYQKQVRVKKVRVEKAVS